MNGNYEINRHMANDKQRTFIQEAERHRLASQARGQAETWIMRVFVVRLGIWLQRSAHHAVCQTASRTIKSLKTLSGLTKKATESVLQVAKR